MNNYLKILSYLKTFEGDEEYHDIENVLIGIDDNIKRKIFHELKNEAFIKLTGGPATVFSTGKVNRDQYGSRSVQWNRAKVGNDAPYKGKITFKGSKHLKDELQIGNDSKMNIHIGNNATANMIVHSPGSTIHNEGKSEEKVNRIIEALKSDATLEIETRDIAISTFSLLQTEIQAGIPTQDTWNKALTIGANIASIGSLVLALVQQFAK